MKVPGRCPGHPGCSPGSIVAATTGIGYVPRARTNLNCCRDCQRTASSPVGQRGWIGRGFRGFPARTILEALELQNDEALFMSENSKFFGIYRGIVTDNLDPLGIGRVMAKVPDVDAVASSVWAMPSVPVAGNQSGVFVVPSVGSGVWIEFEAGDANRPVSVWRLVGECGRGTGSSARRSAARRFQYRDSEPGPELDRHQRPSRADRRHFAQEQLRCDDHRERPGHFHRERQGGQHRAERTIRVDQRRSTRCAVRTTESRARASSGQGIGSGRKDVLAQPEQGRCKLPRGESETNVFRLGRDRA